MATASTTGCRCAVMVLPDPSYEGGLTTEMVWGAVMNRRGTMVDSCGNTSRRTRFRVNGSTTLLSNAAPPTGNMMGYSDGVLVTWCLQPPVGITENVYLDAAILCRVNMQCHNPVPGFLQSQVQIFQRPPEQTPGREPDWAFVVKDITQHGFESDALMVNTAWCLNHVGDAWLAGGYYFQFASVGDSAPAEVFGVPEYGAVYTSTYKFNNWETNTGWQADPLYFATFRSPISGTITLIGFTNFEWAKNQAAGWTGNVPSNTELCIKYARPGPVWANMFPQTTAMPSNKIGYKALFYKIFSAEPPRGGPVYSTQNSISQMPTTAGRTLTTPTITYTSSGLPTPPLPAARYSLMPPPVESSGPGSQPLEPLCPRYNTNSNPLDSTKITGTTLPARSPRSSESSETWSTQDDDEWSCGHIRDSSEQILQDVERISERIWTLQAHSTLDPDTPGLLAQAQARMSQRYHEIIHRDPYEGASAPPAEGGGQLPQWGSLLRKALSAMQLSHNQ